MPGLINAHFHSPGNLMKGCLDGMPLAIELAAAWGFGYVTDLFYWAKQRLVQAERAQAASRLIGTQTSVDQPTAPARRFTAA